jgi:glyoxylase-like metal-dependent hydrolase (beta-lactamase superfamily II)
MNKINVLEIKFGFNDKIDRIYPVIIEDEEEMILVDCGYPNFLPMIEQEAITRGIDIKKLTKIIITHHDFDHMGSLAAFKRKYPSIKVLASIDDEKYINGSEKSLRLQQAESIYDFLSEGEKEGAKAFHSMLESVETCDVDICVKDKDFFDCCGEIEIVTTPGHMPGHISIYIKTSKTLVAGDALVVENNKLAIANPQYTLDMMAAKKSIIKLMSYEIDTIICYHGGVYKNNIEKSLCSIISE